MPPIRVLHVVTIMNMGGLETLIMNLYRNINRDMVQFDFLVHRQEPGIYEDEIIRLGGRIFRVYPISPKTLFQYQIQLRRFFSNNLEYKIVHSHLDTLSTFVLKAAKKAGIPCRIAHSHNSKMLLDIKALFRICSRFFINKYCTERFACSSQAAKWLFGRSELSNKGVVIFKNSIEAQKFQFDEEKRQSIRTELQIDNKLVVGHIGRFEYQKNHDFLIDIFLRINQINPNSVLLLVGTGGLEDKIKEKVISLNLNKNVIFMGVSKRVVDLLHGMDIFIFPSHFEGLGIVLIEAQATGLKCLTSETVPDEAIISPLIEKINLKERPEYWAQKALDYVNGYQRNNMIEVVRKMGYDIKTSAQTLEKFYLNKVEE